MKEEWARYRTIWALERTWLAYVRACIAMGLLGLSILKLTEYHDTGVILNLTAAVLFVWATWWCAARGMSLDLSKTEEESDD